MASKVSSSSSSLFARRGPAPWPVNGSARTERDRIGVVRTLNPVVTRRNHQTVVDSPHFVCETFRELGVVRNLLSSVKVAMPNEMTYDNDSSSKFFEGIGESAK
jgi:hypothetical protein